MKLFQSVYRPLLTKANNIPARAATPAQTGSPLFSGKSTDTTSSTKASTTGITPAHSAPTTVDADGIPVPPGFEDKATAGVPADLTSGGADTSAIPVPSASSLASGPNTFGLPSVPTPGLEREVLTNLSERDPQAAELLKMQAQQAAQGEGFPIVQE